MQALEARLAGLDQEVAERTDYESDSYAQLIQELSDANERLDAIGASSTEEQAHRILQGLGFQKGGHDPYDVRIQRGMEDACGIGQALADATGLASLGRADEPLGHREHRMA